MGKEVLEEDPLEFEDESEVDLEGELISSLEEIERLKVKFRKQKDILLKYVKEEPNSENLIQLKV